MAYQPTPIKAANTPPTEADISAVVSVIPTGFKTYTAATPAFTLAASPTDIIVISGSASKVIRVTNIAISVTENTRSIVQLLLVKRSTANTGGVTVAVAPVAHDSNNPAATAAPVVYTTNPAALGTGLNLLRIDLLVPDISAALTYPDKNFVPGAGFGNGQAIVLRGVAQSLAINLNGTTPLAGFQIKCSITWTEE